MDFKYTLDPNSEEPIMLIDKHIGMDTEDGEGIMGDQFTRELMFLDTLNKKRIQVWINSGGGVVTDGEQIYHAILHSKTPVDTVCTGTAASIAGPLFVAGRTRTLNDYAKVMMHPVSGGDEKSMQAFEKSIRTMLSSRSFLNEDQIGKLMSRTSWIFPDEARQMGLCTDINYSHGVNVNAIPAETASYKEYRTIVNKLIENIKAQPMKKVTNKLGLNENSNEDAIYSAIEAMENKFKAEAAENKSKFDKYVDEMAETKKAKDESEAKYNALKAKYDEMEKKEEENKLNEAKNKAEALKAEAKVFIANAVKLGKIENKADVIEKMETQYETNPEGVKDIVNAIPVSIKAPIINKIEHKAGDNFTPIDPANTSSYVAAQNAKNLAKISNRTK